MRNYVIMIVFTLAFGVIYETQSHGVFSWHMGFLFLGPLVGVFPYLIEKKMGTARRSLLAESMWDCAIATYTVGSFLHGVMEIYGTTSPYIFAYYCLTAFLAAGAALCCIRGKPEKIEQ